MKALTLWQPWASLVATGAKQIETRTWTTKYRGPLAIHASARVPFEVRQWWSSHAGKRAQGWLELAGMPLPHDLDALPIASVIAVCQLVDVALMVDNSGDPPDRDGQSTWVVGTETTDERIFGNFQPGRYAWLLHRVMTLAAPIEDVKGALGLWEWGA